MSEELNKNERKQIREILDRRAAEIASFHSEYTRSQSHYGSVELALMREIDRLRKLADRACPWEPEPEDETD